MRNVRVSRMGPIFSVAVMGAALAVIPGSVAGSVAGATQDVIELTVAGANAQTGSVDLVGAGDSQSLSVTQGCNLSTNGSILAFSGGSKPAGIKSGGIGVRSQGPGQSCGEIQGSEQLAVSLGSSTALDDLAIGGANLDVEVKGNAVVVVTTSLFGMTGDVFTLNTGTYASDQLADAFATSTTAVPVAECNGGSDSRPDSRDNCRWTLDPDLPFDSFTMVVSGGGAVSLEGGADTPVGGVAAPTTFLLVETFDGILDCGDSVEHGNTEIYGVITRLDNPDGSACTPKPYNLDLLPGNELVFAPEGLDAAAYSAAISGPLDETGPFNTWLEYDQDGDGPGAYEVMQWCVDSTVSTSLSGGDIERLVTDATLPAGETWCVAAIDALESDDSVVFWVYGLDDPGFRF